MPKYLPKNAYTRQVTASLFKACVQAIEQAQADDLRLGAWKLTMVLPKLLYRLSERTNAAQRYKRVAAMLLSNSPAQWQQLLDQKPGAAKGRLSNVERAHQLVAVGELSRGLSALTSTGGPVRLSGPEMRTITDVLYPACPQPDALLGPLAANVEALRVRAAELTTFGMAKAVRKMKALAAKGSTGYSKELFLVLMSNGSMEDLLRLLRLCIVSNMPESLWPYMAGGNLSLFLKPGRVAGDPSSYRPVVPQNALTKLAEKLIFPQAEEVRRALAPIQLGVCVEAGVEKMAKGAIAALANDPQAVLVQVDLKNAYGATRRSFVQQQLRTNPDFSNLAYLEPWLVQCYGASNRLSAWVDGQECTMVGMDTGFLQGVTLSTLFFCIAHHEPLKAFVTSSAGAISDDLCIVGQPAQLQAELDDYVQRLAPTGNSVVPHKSKVFLQRPDQLQTDITINGGQLETTTTGTVLAGTPLGTDGFIDEHIRGVMSTIKNRDAAIASMPLQDQFILTRHCTQPMLTHILRSVPPQLTAAAAVELDELLVARIAAIAGATDLQVVPVKGRVFLSSKDGGLGLVSARDARFAAYAGSWAMAVSHMDGIHPTTRAAMEQQVLQPEQAGWIQQGIDNALFQISELGNLCLAPDSAPSPALTHRDLAGLYQRYEGKVQRGLRSITTVGRFRQFCAANINNSNETKANFLSSCQAGAASWLWAIPSVPELTFTDPQFRIGLRLFLGLGTGLVREGLPIINCCAVGGPNGATVHELHEEHIFRCRRTGSRHDRHGVLCETTKSLMALINIPHMRREPRGLGPDQGGPDILVWHMPHEGKLLMDVTTKLLVSDDVLARAAREPLMAAKKQEQVKRDKYAEQARQHGAKFLPLVWETPTGAFGPGLNRFLGMLGRAASDAVDVSDLYPANWTANSFVAYARQVLSAAYVKSTADGAIALVTHRYRDSGVIPAASSTLREGLASFLAFEDLVAAGHWGRGR